MKLKICLFLILIFGFFLRFYNANWDANNHLHPDERFLTMVGTTTKIPSNLFDYFNPQKSSLNPLNNGYNFFVYGNLPLIVNKLLAVVSNNDNYNAYVIQGRNLSAIADFICIFLVYQIVFLLERKYRLAKKTKVLAAFFYAISVLPIQLAHFFTVDPFLNLFMLLSFYQALKFFYVKNKKSLVLSGVFFGLALACKITAVFILPLNLFFLLDWEKILVKKQLNLRKILLKTIFFFIFVYLAFRIGDPYKFVNNNWLDLRLNNTYIENLRTLKTYDNPDIWYPPGVQWINKPAIIFALKNLAFFGVGLGYFFLIVFGCFFIFRKKIFNLQIVFFWVLAFFLYQSTQFVKSMRYFIFIYPFLAIFAAIGLEKLLFLINKVKNIFVRYTLQVTSYTLILLWPLMFFSIYTQEHSRVVASNWMYKNISENAVILSEYWDDALPIFFNPEKQFQLESVPVFDPDTPEKWQKINQQLRQADYYVLSSNRGWGSIMAVPKKYPLTSKFYRDLFANKTNYKLIKEFTSYPSLRWLGIPLDFPDQWSEEAFTVYDHPKVLIFKKK